MSLLLYTVEDYETPRLKTEEFERVTAKFAFTAKGRREALSRDYHPLSPTPTAALELHRERLTTEVARAQQELNRRLKKLHAFYAAFPDVEVAKL